MPKYTKKTQLEEETPTKPNNDGGEQTGGEGEETLETFTQEDLDRIASKVRAEEKAKKEKEVEEIKKKAEEDAIRKANLSVEEREKELLAEREQENEKREKTLTLRENKLEGRAMLRDLEMPEEFVDFILNENIETQNESIEKIHQVWTAKVAEEVKKQIKGEAPKDPSSGDGDDSLDLDEDRTNYM
jgi:hypothetical protein